MRKAIRPLLALLLLLLFGLAGPLKAEAIRSGPNASPSHFFHDESFEFEFLRTLGAAYYGGADIMECLDTARRIGEGDEDAWYDEWEKTADSVHQQGIAAEKNGAAISAGRAFLRAANYYRTMDFYLRADPDDPRILSAGRKSRQTFLRGMRQLGYHIETVRIPYEQTTLPAYLILPHQGGKKLPLLIVHSGFDGTKEEVVLYPGFAALERGYAVLAFDGPGQGEALREQKLYFRPDWEKVLSPVVDYVRSRREVDSGKIAYMGISMGGMLAPRAAAHEHRIKALIANNGLYSFYESLAQRMQGIDALAFSDPDRFNSMVAEVMPNSTAFRWMVNNGKMAFGVPDAASLFRRLKQYSAADAPGIRAHSLILDGERESMPGQARKLYDLITAPKTYLLFKSSESADLHCQVAGSATGAQYIFEWLDKLMKGDRP